MKGIYVLKFEIYPNIYKVGCSRNISKRVKQIQTDSAILGNVELVYQKEFIDFIKAEQEIHLLLDKYRYQENREFFKINLDHIINTIDSVDASKYINENTVNEIRPDITNQIYNILLLNVNNKNEINITANKRKQICEQLHIKNNQITNSLARLKKKGKIRGDKGTFLLIDKE